MKKNTWNIRLLVDDSFVPSSQQTSVIYCRLMDLMSAFSIVLNRLHARLFLARFVSYLLSLKQTLPEINVHAHLFGTLEYAKDLFIPQQHKMMVK